MAGPKTSTDMLGQLRFGELNDDLTKQIRAMVLAVSEAKKPGTLTLKLTFKPGKAGQLEIADDLTVKLPKPEKGVSMFFPTVEGNLERDDPRQKQFEGIRTVDQEIAARRAPVEDTPEERRSNVIEDLPRRAAAGA